MAVSHAPQRIATRPAAPADPQAVLSFLAAGHSTGETAQRFGIAERSVRRIRQRQEERDDLTQRRQRMTASHPAERHPARPVDTVPLTPLALARPTFAPANPHDLAGPHTLWRCPISGDLTPVPPGARRGEWEAERRSPTPQKVAETTADLDREDRPDTRTGPPFSASESAMDSGPSAVTQPLPAITTEHKAPVPISITADYVRRRDTAQPARSGLDLAQLGDALLFMVGPVPVVAWLVFGLVVLLLAGW